MELWCHDDDDDDDTNEVSVEGNISNVVTFVCVRA